MTEIGSASTAYCLVLFMVCLLLLVLFVCECGRSRDEMTTNLSLGASVLTIAIPDDSYKMKLLSRHALPSRPLRDIPRKPDQFKKVDENSKLMKELTNCSLEIVDGNESEISQPDKIYERI